MSKILKYIYSDLNDVLRISSDMVDIFRQENLYIDHSINITQTNKFLVLIEIKKQ